MTSPAADRYLRAASHAVELGGNADAFRQLTRALKLLPDDDHERRFTAHRLREEILRRLAKRPQQLRELHALRKEAEALGEPGKLATAHCALAQFYIDVGKAPAALRAVAPALQYARDAEATRCSRPRRCACARRSRGSSATPTSRCGSSSRRSRSSTRRARARRPSRPRRRRRC